MKCSGLLIFFMGFLLWQGCATVKYQEKVSDYQEQIRILQKKLHKNPDNMDAIRDLGVIYFQTRQYAKAKDYLNRAYKASPKDAKTLLYLGLCLEFENNNEAALKFYEKYSEIPRYSPWREKLEGRYRWLTRQQIRQEMRKLLEQEAQLAAKRLSPKRIAVFPFTFSDGNKRLAPLGKGLAEMIITDLTQVKSLQVVERVRVQALLEEIALGQTGLVEESSAPRYGKLLAAGKIIHGKFAGLSRNRIRLDAAYWDIINQQFPQPTEMTDALNNLFLLEKDIVFEIIERMGITLTPRERQRILHIPTKNLQAFLAYCMGLEQEDAGNFEAALQSYKTSTQLDPDFNLARKKMEETETLTKAGQDKESFLSSLSEMERWTKGTTVGGNLVNRRLQNLSSSLGSNFIPGPDSRESVEEVTTAGISVVSGELPEPPLPPPGK
ncbi:hypothetical protein B1H10_03865 [candidate division KSB1 bacterium 4484_188]|nr:MAG: hypothetical protein B1H10_03865 [candidate division KSB1 bacterium 4484_188]